MSLAYSALAVLCAYVLGSLSFAVIVSRLMGLSDPRSYGSKNPGATNVLRSGSKVAAIITLVLDAAKGWLAVALVFWFGQPHGLGEGTAALAGLASFLGHLFPVFFKFQGGKGVATAAGALFGYDLWLGLAVLVVWVGVAAIWRYSSLASILAALAAPLVVVLANGEWFQLGKPIFGATVVMSVLLVWRHAQNITRLMQGKESKLGAKK
jgi:acyl phosphate:glycerol-3-phosphate acyltransferase